MGAGFHRDQFQHRSAPCIDLCLIAINQCRVPLRVFAHQVFSDLEHTLTPVQFNIQLPGLLFKGGEFLRPFFAQCLDGLFRPPAAQPQTQVQAPLPDLIAAQARAESGRLVVVLNHHTIGVASNAVGAPVDLHIRLAFMVDHPL